VLLLQGKIRIHSDQAFIDFSQLLQLVADYLVESNPPHADAAMQVCCRPTTPPQRIDTVLRGIESEGASIA